MSWDKMDKKAFEDSEVLKNLEQGIIRAAINLSQELEKKSNLKDVSKDLTSVNQQAGPAKQNLEEINKTVEKMYSSDDDGELDGYSELEDAAISLADALRELSYAIVDAGDKELAYKLEKLVNELEEVVEDEAMQEESEYSEE